MPIKPMFAISVLALVGLLIWTGYLFLLSSQTALPSPLPYLVQTPAASPVTPSAPSPSSQLQTNYYYPVTNYQERLSVRPYGASVVANDRLSLPCGAPFTGYHVADDLEVTPAELTTAVPVYAIATGRVLRIDQVTGYGGLLVVGFQLGDQQVTANYGHINLSQTKLKVGDEVKAGQILSYLGEACSNQTGGERKHLHFALHQGPVPAIHGYVDSRSSLAAWLDPKDTLKTLNAAEPGQ